MRKLNNKVTAIYLMWSLLHITLFLAKPGIEGFKWVGDKYRYNENRYFYPFTKGYWREGEEKLRVFNNFDLQFYDITELSFYLIAPIFIYYIITLLRTK